MPNERTTRRRPVKALAGLAAAMLLLAALGAQSGSAAEDPTYPGVPTFPVAGDWVAPRASGINQVAKAKQWIRLPSIVMLAWNHAAPYKTDNRCVSGSRYFPYRQVTDNHATGFIRSSAGAPEPYGQLGPFKARTVAFGSIPVEVSVVIRQPRDSENLPVGVEIKQFVGEYCADTRPFPNIVFPGSIPENARWAPATADGLIEVAVTAIKVDGVDLGLRKGCGTAKPGTIALRSKEFFTMNPENLTPGVMPSTENLFTTPYFSLVYGGLLTGTVDIPAFKGCTTRSGEDVSRLLTATVSGADNPVTMRSEGVKEALACRDPSVPCVPLPEVPFPAAD